MAKKTKENKPASAPALAARELLAENVVALMRIKYSSAKYGNDSARLDRLARDANCEVSTLQRLVRPVREKEPDFRPRPRKGKNEGEQLPVFVTLQTIADVAAALNTSPAALLDSNLNLEHFQKSDPHISKAHQDELHRKSG